MPVSMPILTKRLFGLMDEAEMLEAYGGRLPVVKTIYAEKTNWQLKGFVIYINTDNGKFGYDIDVPYLIWHGENQKPTFNTAEEAEKAAWDWVNKNWKRFQ
jgi:hypothetical protein